VKKLWYPVFLALLVWSQAVFAEIIEGPKPNSVGNLELEIVASGTPEYIKEWLSAPSSHGVTIKRIRAVKPEQLIVASFLVSGMSADEEGKYSFSVSMYVLGPDGKPIFGERNYAKGSGILPGKPTYIMADPALDIVLEESDPAGDYIIVAQVEDHVSGAKADCSYLIKLSKSEL